MITRFGFFVGSPIVCDVAAGSVSTSVASDGGLEGVLVGVFGATIGWEFVGMGGKFMGVLEL